MTSSRGRLGQQECGLTSRTQNDGNCVEHILVSHVRRFRICSPECMFHFYPFFTQLSVESVLNFTPRVSSCFIPRRVDEFTLCTCEIAEGRMHQIRLHMSSPRRNGAVRGVGDLTNVTNQGRAALGSPIVSEFYYQKAKQMIEEITVIDRGIKFSSKDT